MRRLIAVLIVLLCINANAFFAGANIWDSRIQSDNIVYKPGGVIGFAIEAGVFNEPENMVDYKMSLELRRFGYSFDNGNESVIFWSVGLRPLSWSFTYRKFIVEAYVSLFMVFSHDELNKETEKKLDDFVDYFTGSYGFKLGYRLNDKLTISLMGDFVQLELRFNEGRNYSFIDDFTTYMVGGIGLSIQYNIF